MLITSRRPLDLGPNVPVGGLSDEEALAFLAKRTGLADDAGAGALAAELERVPLALAHAVAVITRQNLHPPRRGPRRLASRPGPAVP